MATAPPVVVCIRSVLKHAETAGAAAWRGLVPRSAVRVLSLQLDCDIYIETPCHVQIANSPPRAQQFSGWRNQTWSDAAICTQWREKGWNGCAET